MSSEPLTEFDVHSASVRGVDVVTVSGEVDIATAPAVARAMAAAGGRLLVDLTAVSFLDSSGLATLIAANREMDGDGRRFALACPPYGAAAYLLELSRTASYFVVYPTPERALDALDGAG
jgi:anti-sigma B factor antagonist